MSISLLERLQAENIAMREALKWAQPICEASYQMDTRWDDTPVHKALKHPETERIAKRFAAAERVCVAAQEFNRLNGLSDSPILSEWAAVTE